MNKNHQIYKEIESTINCYLEAGRKGDTEMMKKAFHDEATILGIYHGENWGGHIQKLYDYVNEEGPATTMTAEITLVDATETSACAKIEITDWTGTDFTDYFTLIKFDGKWLITAKVFTELK